jgi:membrane associated rhomboid family serine protease
MIILPYGHEKQSVNRLPWVTFIIIGLNILIFLALLFETRRNESMQQEKFNEFIEYYTYHAYLEYPPEMQKFYRVDDKSTFMDIMKETKSRLSEETINKEQAELENLGKEVIELINENPAWRFGYKPGDPHFFSLFTNLFMHAGFMHLFGNMLFLYLAGASIEDLWGRPLFVAFYLICGIAATLTHGLIYSASSIPLIGASGAIAGLMGAFLYRLYKTKIRFFYFFWVFITRPFMGTFNAPAYIMLPLWLLSQFFYASFTNEAGGVAFWAHIGGFVFGFGFAVVMKSFQIEEKYITPKIEKEVTMPQNPLFEEALELSEKKSYPEAMNLLKKVVQQEPSHLGAHQEMLHIAMISEDSDTYEDSLNSILDILIRKKDWELFQEFYRRYQESSKRQNLPAKTLLGLSTLFEEHGDYISAIQHYEELVQNYPDDPVVMKAHIKFARLFLDKLNKREKGIEAFWRSYHHKHATEEWRDALKGDLERFEIPDEKISDNS